MKILLVDDELPIRSYLRTLVDWEGHGYELIEAENGAAAIELLKAGNIQLVLMDITMPVMSGLETLEWMVENGVKSIVTLLTTTTSFTLRRRPCVWAALTMCSKVISAARAFWAWWSVCVKSSPRRSSRPSGSPH